MAHLSVSSEENHRLNEPQQEFQLARSSVLTYCESIGNLINCRLIYVNIYSFSNLEGKHIKLDVILYKHRVVGCR